jgi:rod shape-determining protein MreC
MKQRASLSYFLLAVGFFLLLNVKFDSLEKIRGPFFGFEELFAFSSVDSKLVELAELKAENLHLKEQMEEVKAYLLSEDHIEEICAKCLTYSKGEESHYSAFYRRKLEELINFINISKWQITANVIYREPGSWSSAIWIDVGSVKNKILNKTIVAVDSPVVFGDYLIGVVERVGKYKSLVRLITDSKIAPSVRCVRGDQQLCYINNRCKKLSELLELFPKESYQNLQKALKEQINEYKKDGVTNYYAKGILHGSSNPIWRSRSQTLTGVGFNYDFGDEQGAPKSLHEQLQEPLFQKGDALITTGMDGVFPPNLLVAFVSDISPLREGDVSCNLKAKIALDEFSDLRKVTVLPPISLGEK